jgi:hypothetical protein
MKATIQRAEILEVALPDGRRFDVPPPTRGAMRKALALEMESGEVLTPRDGSTRRAKQLAALVGTRITMTAGEQLPGASILGSLTPRQEEALLVAIIVEGSQREPAKPGHTPRSVSRAERLRRFDADTVALAVHLHRTVNEVEASVGFVESLLLLEAIYKQDTERLKFEAALHGVRLSR